MVPDFTQFDVKKNTFCTLMGLLFSLTLIGQNRIATLHDQKIYGDYIQPGDLIIDSPNRINKDKGQRDVFYYFMPKQWPGLREGATIWIDGDKLGVVREIKFGNTSNSLTPWHIESLRVKNIPHTKVVANSFDCQGLKHFELDGESPFFPGLTSWPESRKFLSGSFGFQVISDFRGGHGYTVNVRDGGTIKLKGFEVQHGFSGVRINGGNYDITVESIEISNFYIHDTGNGEGQYLGATHKPPLAKIRNLKIHHGIIARTAAEALQLQHLAGGTDVHNVTIFAADVKWMNEFMTGQDTGIQWCVDGGENFLHHVIVDGYASMGLVPFGSSELSASGVSKVSNVLFNDGRDTGMYLHKSGSFGIHWVFDSIYFRGIVAPYYEQTGRKERKFFVSRKHGTDRYTFTNIFHDGSKPRVFEDTAGIEVGKVRKIVLPPPVYENSGFHEPAHKIKQWHPCYGGYFPVSKRENMKVEVSTRWDAGDIAIETKGEYAFYKCIKTHAADTRRPAEHPFFMKLTWDAHGVRCDQPGWKADLEQSSLPPDDMRLVKNNHWRKLGMGFQEDLINHFQASSRISENK
jgi:hypothetical protein